ncbi:hypothetical protein [Corallococcus silvisoli]|uniref:hypothetical protein n=1 Tax=Corallococcus silvisoli TaxID=2697031 RepID=UPI0013787CAB|nr:hypothetical protein [Corallococcus silvisoli]NBD11795.1 hypothetical protein [Corallococcus silvisoli]
MLRMLPQALPFCLLALGCESPRHAQLLERRAALREVHLQAFSTAATGFADTRWSMSLDEVRAQHPDAVPLDQDVLELRTELWNRPASIHFVFSQEKLAEVSIHLAESGDLRDAYREVASRLQATYGEPQEVQDTAKDAANQRAVLGALTLLTFAADSTQALHDRRPPDENLLHQLNGQAAQGAVEAYWDTQEYTLRSRWNTVETKVHLVARRTLNRQGLILSYSSTVLAAASGPRP